jgi:protein TonB
MTQAATFVPGDFISTHPAPTVRWEGATPRFQDLVVSRPVRHTAGRGLTAFASFFIHGLLLAVVVAVPLLMDDFLPETDRAVRGFFVTPADAQPPPPPPPPPAAAARVTSSAAVAPRLPDEPARFLAPIEIPDQVRPDQGFDLGVPGGVDGGVDGGVEGGVPGGVVGGIVGGLPDVAPPAPAKVIRVGGHIHAPKLAYRVAPEYPQLARDARVGGMVIVEAQVGTDGRVKVVKVLRGIPLLDEAAVEAVRQWRYQPLLLNGEPTQFILTVTVLFHVTPGQGPSAE